MCICIVVAVVGKISAFTKDFEFSYERLSTLELSLRLFVHPLGRVFACSSLQP